ncbi:cytosolic chaperonin protein, theta subunit [Guillardia theta CCMP2712]|uniref:CCT-theta n=2 Tax=Guillardia theta TaxID=55529 RepID=L1J9H1_GUITC|nr:cytosolic chaperonin protein, theta subunit [Guillardia theta CCMP2712]EKX45203.1 cytosolic chaperonin protein, theta subunit [Guillardia theta CCMP2712]|eukprot:XP_005832183.1 cytosolic chaperonin protein, theta subunit [Guillardia theta CCMP2712]
MLGGTGGIALTELLKDGHKHFQGIDEAVAKNIEACKKLSTITRTSIGPNGMNKMVVNHLGKLFVTNDAATIVKEMEVIHPAAKLVALASQTQKEEIGDTTNLVVVLAGTLLEGAEALLRQGLPIADIIAGYTKAYRACLTHIDSLSVKSIENIRSEEEVSNALRATVCSKQNGLEDFLCPLIAKACVQIVPKEASQFNVDNVRVAKIQGMSVYDSFLVKGFVLTRDSEGTIKHVTDAKIVVFGTEVDLSATETKGNVLIKNAEELMNYSKSEEEAIEKIVQEIAATGVNVLVAQSTISEMSLHFLERAKIMVIKCPSKFEIARLCKLSGATSLARFGAPLPEEIGKADRVSVDELGGQPCTTFVRDSLEQTKVSTIILRASTSNHLDDLSRAIDNGVNIYKQMTKDSRFVAGGGACELRMAAHLKEMGGKTPGLEQYAIKKYAEALETIPRTLAENAGQDTTSTISNLYADHTAGKLNHGINIDSPGTRDMLEASILDHLVSKKEAMRLASEAAITVLRVDTIIMARQSGGPDPNRAPG